MLGPLERSRANLDVMRAGVRSSVTSVLVILLVLNTW